MRRFLAVWLTLCALLYGSPGHADNLTLLGIGGGGGGGGGGCAQATTFLARTSGLSGTQQTAYTNMICGMVTDGTWTVFDFLYIFATNTTTTANLNLKSTSFTLAQTGTVTFTAGQGYTPDGSTGFLRTGFIPSSAGGSMTLNSTHIGACAQSNTNTALNVLIGSGNNSTTSLFLAANLSVSNFAYTVNDFGFNAVGSVSNAQGDWIATRTDSSNVTIYDNGSGVASYSAASVALEPVQIYIGAFNQNGVAADFSPVPLMAAFGGGALNATQAANVSSRISTFLAAVSAPAGC